jgi:hypothetical protein
MKSDRPVSAMIERMWEMKKRHAGISSALAFLPLAVLAASWLPASEGTGPGGRSLPCGHSKGACADRTAESDESSGSAGLSRFLRPDGTLDLPPEGIPGSIDPTGFELVSGPGETPRFRPTSTAGQRAAGDECWSSKFSSPTFPGPIYALASDGTNLYAGGEFQSVEGVLANGVAKWNGTAWSSVGVVTGPWCSDSCCTSSVRALIWDGASLYAGGSFSSIGGVAANNIAKWNGSSWSPLGSGTDFEVRCLLLEGTRLYAGGNRLIRWNGSEWTELLGWGTAILALAWDGANLYIGLPDSDNGDEQFVWKWNGTTWIPLTPYGYLNGFDGDVRALVWNGTSLYAGGAFTRIGSDSTARGVAVWNGSWWGSAGTGLPTPVAVESLAWNGSQLLAGSSGWVHTLDGTTWSNSPIAGTVHALQPTGTDLFAGVGVSGGVWSWELTGSVSKRNGTAWEALSGVGAESIAGLDGSVWALATDGSNVYAGGEFARAGTVAANRIAMWNGSAWSPIGSGLLGTSGIWGSVRCLLWNGTDLYAAGNFATAGGSPAANIAKWNGSVWNPLGSGVNATVLALAWDGANLYAGGGFTMAGGAPANRIALWNGSVWSPLGAGLNGTVYALAWDGADLNAGGNFSQAGGATARNVARWSGGGWSSLGTGLDNWVEALAWDGANLYAGGAFTPAGGVPAARIAKWNGSVWSPLGAGVGGSTCSNIVHSLAWDGVDLYVGGEFATAGPVASHALAKWNGEAWSGVGSGADSSVACLLRTGTGLFAGGSFTTAGAVPSVRIAAYDLSGAAITSHPTNRVICPASNTTFSAAATGTDPAYRWQENAGSGFVNLTDGGVYSGASTPTMTLTGVSTGMSGRTYRCVVTATCGSAASNPAGLTVIAAPPEITPQLWTSETTLSWPGSAPGYTVYRGSAPDFPALLTSAVDSCVRWTGAATSASMADDPAEAPGGLYWYLVTGTSAAGCEGTAGMASGGLRIVNGSGACP